MNINKYKHMKTLFYLFFIVFAGSCISSKDSNTEQVQHIDIKNDGSISLELSFKKGSGHNSPSFALWVEDSQGNFLHPVYVTQSVANGVYNVKEVGTLQWIQEKGEAYRPAALPYFFHKAISAGFIRQIPTSANPFPDAYSGATPSTNFDMAFLAAADARFKILLEINQTWDWNKYWTNDKYPDNINYKHSSQPSVVYSVDIDLNNLQDAYYLNPIGHGHYAGENGNLYTNLKTLTTALQIIDQATIVVVRK